MRTTLVTHEFPSLALAFGGFATIDAMERFLARRIRRSTQIVSA
jgi:hypothetical protein